MASGNISGSAEGVGGQKLTVFYMSVRPTSWESDRPVGSDAWGSEGVIRLIIWSVSPGVYFISTSTFWVSFQLKIRREEKKKKNF